jgi:exodeoxyribonuclease VII small subunit
MAVRKASGTEAAEAVDASAPPFEQSLERLEKIVEDLEAGSLSLEESLARYEEGMRLSRQLAKMLDEAEKRIERLVEDPSGTPTTRPLELELKPAERGTRDDDLPF